MKEGKNMERTIRVTGTGKVSIKPDITIINLEFSHRVDTDSAAARPFRCRDPARAAP